MEAAFSQHTIKLLCDKVNFMPDISTIYEGLMKTESLKNVILLKRLN